LSLLRQSEINRLAEELPGYTFLHAYSAVLPFYECNLEVRIMVRHDLSALQQYTLACIAKMVDTIDAIDVVLGAGRDAIRAALANLISADLIKSHDQYADENSCRFGLTEKGVDALMELGWRTPQTTNMRVLYDGLSGELVAPNRLNYIGGGESAKHGLHFIPSRCASPNLGDIEYSAVRRVMREIRRSDQRRLPDGDLHDLIGIVGRRPVYRKCEIVAFEGTDSAIAFRVLDRGKRLVAYEEQLTSMFPVQPEILPLERSETLPLPSQISPLIPPELLGRADQLEDERDQLRSIIEREESSEQEFFSHEEISDSSVGQPTTREQLELLKKRLDEVEKERNSLRLVETDEHRVLLEKALKHARRRVIIISPWLSPAAINDELQLLMQKALEKGVEVIIGWGIPPEEANAKAIKKDERSEFMLRQLERMGKAAEEAAAKRAKLKGSSRSDEKAKEGHRTLGRLRVVRLGDTHEKILIADSKFAVVTSFNFLSFRADPRRGFRRETGVYYEMKAQVEELASNVLERIEKVEAKLASSG
jgi:hypothetical protein